MANRQIYQLTARALALTDVLPSQDAAGSIEAGKSTLQTLKELMQGGSKKLVVRVDFSPSFSSTILESDYSGLTILAFTNPSNGLINMQVSSSIFTANKSVFVLQSLNVGGVAYYVCGSRILADTISLDIIKHDGTQTSTPYFSNYMITIITYP